MTMAVMMIMMKMSEMMLNIMIMMIKMIHRMVEEEVEEGDRLALWEKARLLEEKEKQKKEEEEERARLGENRSIERKIQTVDPSKAAELPSLVERLAKVAAIAPPAPPSPHCTTPPTPSGMHLSLILFLKYGQYVCIPNKYILSCLISSQFLPALVTLVSLGPGGKSPESWS